MKSYMQSIDEDDEHDDNEMYYWTLKTRNVL